MTGLTLLLADDHVVVREGLKRLIESHSGMRVVAEAGDADTAAREAEARTPDIALIDLGLGENNGASAAREIRARSPATKVVALTVHEDSGYLHAMLEAGAVGYILKRAASEELIHALGVVAQGGIYVDPRVAGKLIAFAAGSTRRSGPHAGLSARETEVIRLIAQGYSNKEISAQLGVSVKTIETYKARSMEKLGLRSRVDIVRLAARRGWLPPG